MLLDILLEARHGDNATNDTDVHTKECATEACLVDR